MAYKVIIEGVQKQEDQFQIISAHFLWFTLSKVLSLSSLDKESTLDRVNLDSPELQYRCFRLRFKGGASLIMETSSSQRHDVNNLENL